MTTSLYTPNQDLLLDLISRCAIRDKQAFKQLYEQTSSALLGVLMRLLSDKSSAEDCLQEAYLQIWNRADQYHVGKGDVFPWMVTIARYRAIDCIRKQKPNVDLDNSPPLMGAEDAEGINQTALTRCLAELKPESAQLIIKSYVEGYTQAELSEQTQTPIGTVKSWMRRGLAALKQCLKGYE